MRMEVLQERKLLMIISLSSEWFSSAAEVWVQVLVLIPTTIVFIYATS